MQSNYAPPINSHPFRTTPTNPPVCMVSDPPPASRHSISASPSSHVILVCAGTSSCCNCSASAERISARARPLLALIVSSVLRQDVTSLVESNVDMISWISDGCGAAMQSYIVSLVTTSGSGRGWSLGAFFNGSGIPETWLVKIFKLIQGNETYCLHDMPGGHSVLDACHLCSESPDCPPPLVGY